MERHKMVSAFQAITSSRCNIQNPHGVSGMPRAEILDGIVPVENDEALEMARRLAREEGILCGISSGAAVTAALKYAQGDSFRPPANALRRDGALNNG